MSPVATPPVVLAGYQLCATCTWMLTQAVGGLRKQLRPCASCRAAVKVRLLMLREGP